MKNVLFIFFFVLLVGNAYAQGVSKEAERARWARSICIKFNSVEEELKNAWSEPDEDFKRLTDRAMRDDPQALYALSQVENKTVTMEHVK